MSVAFRYSRILVVFFIPMVLAQCGNGAGTFPTKEAAAEWLTRNVFVGLQCNGLSALNSADVHAKTVIEQIPGLQKQTRPSYVTIEVKFGTTKACSLEMKATCDSSGKVQSIETKDHPCP